MVRVGFALSSFDSVAAVQGFCESLSWESGVCANAAPEKLRHIPVIRSMNLQKRRPNADLFSSFCRGSQSAFLMQSFSLLQVSMSIVDLGGERPARLGAVLSLSWLLT